MAALTLRQTKGTQLTNAEIDANFTALNNELAVKGPGSVTSVGLSVPTGLTVSGSPITSSGTLAISLTAGYSIPTTASQTNWDAAYTDRNKWDGGSTGLVAATARTSLGLVIGTNVQAWDADLDAIAALAGTSGFLKKTAANTWALDTSTYLTGITSGQVTTALGFTPYNATNPSGYITSSALSAYLPLAGGTLTGPLVVTSTGGAATDGLIVNSNGASGVHITPASLDTTQSGRLFFTTSTAGQGFSVRNSAGSLFIQSGATYGSSSGSTVALTLSQAGALNTAGAITQNGSQVLTAGNYTSYSPSLTGTGASGSWGISITGSSASTTGNAATVTNGVYTTGDQTIGGVKTFSSRPQSAGLSDSWGVTSTTQTGAYNATMGTNTSATWLLSGTSGGVFRGGIQVLDAGGVLRIYEGANYVQFSNNTLTATTFSGALSGNATTASTLQTARNINGVSFNGSADITVADSTKLPLAGGTMTGAISFAAGQTWPTFNQSTTGSAATLTTGRTITLTGDVTYTSGSFNGSANVTGAATLASSGVTAGTYTKITVDAKGRATVGALLTAADIPALTLENLPDAWVKRAVKAATTANITLSGAQTIDSIALVAGDRVLVKDQTTSSQNGLYVVSASTWTRSTDADTASEVAGAHVSVDQGTVNAGLVFDTDFKSTDTLGTTAMTWARVVDVAYFTTVGNNLVRLTNPSAVAFLRVNADNTVSALDAATFRTAIGAGTSSTTGTVTSVSGTGTVSGLTLTGTVTGSGNLTLGGTLSLTSGNVTTALGYTPLSTAGGTLTGTLFFGNATSPNTNFIQFGDNTGWTLRMMTNVSGTPTERFRFVDTGAFNAVGAITQNGSQVLHAGNYTSYSPSLTGSGASGTWGISVTGNAATVTNGLVSTGSYADPAWLTSVNYSKLTGTVPTWNQSTTGNAATATALQTARTIGGVSFNGTANINLPGVNAAGNQNTTGTAAGLTDNSSWMLNRGSVAAASIDTATLNGFYTQTNASDSQGLLVFNAGGSLGPLQMTFTYGGLMQFRGKTDSTTWTPWKTVVTSANVSTYALPISGGTLTGAYLDFSNTSPSLRITSGPGTFYIGDDDIVNLGSGAVVATPSSRISSGVAILSTHAYATGQGDNKTHFGYYNGSSYVNYIRGAATYFDSATLQIGGNQALHAGNYTSYSPSLTGSGASGTWGINVTGNAGSASTQAKSSATTVPASTAYAKWLFATNSTSGTTDWNDVSNTRPGTGEVLLLGSHTNGPGGGNYYHPFNIEYGGIDGVGNVTQMAVAYGNAANDLFMRGRFGGAWTSWIRFLNSSNYTSYPIASSQLTGTIDNARLNGGTYTINVTGSSGSTTGNAATATILQTARTINGVSFNGSANITVADSTKLPLAGGTMTGAISFAVGQTWPTFNQSTTGSAATLTTARTFTIGNTGKTFNGSANVGWTLAEIGALPLSGGSLTGTLGTTAGVNLTRDGATADPYAPLSVTRGTASNFAYASFTRAGQVAWVFGINTSNTLVIGGGTSGIDGTVTSNRLALDTASNLTAGGNVTAYSDERLKKDWAPLASDYVSRLALIKSGTYTRIDSGERQAGSSAQDWQELLPEVVMAGSDDAKTLSLAYGNAALVSAVELAKDNRELRARVERLEALVEKLLEK